MYIDYIPGKLGGPISIARPGGFAAFPIRLVADPDDYAAKRGQHKGDQLTLMVSHDPAAQKGK